MGEQLKSCPFCGGDEPYVRLPTCRIETPYNPLDRLYPVARCSCGAEVCGDNEDYEGKTAIAAWNRRAGPVADPGDTRRLDWLETHSNGLAMRGRNTGRWTVGLHPSLNSSAKYHGSTLRAAIDAALTEEGSKS